MNLFESDYCPICTRFLDSNNECNISIHYYSYNYLSMFIAEVLMDVVLYKNGNYIILDLSGIQIISGTLEIELTIENKSEVFQFLFNKLNIIKRNLLFL